MTLSVPSRQTVRERLAALMESEINEYDTVYDHIPRTFDGNSPVGTVSSVGFSRGTQPYLYDYRFVIGNWVRRDLAAGVGASEDLLDTLMEGVAQMLQDFAADGVLHSVRLEDTEESETAYPVVDGTPYRVEFVPVRVRPQVTI